MDLCHYEITSMENKALVGKSTVFCRSFVKVGSERVEMAFLQHMQCVLPSDAVDERLRCECLR